jgi:hypothetical protein
MIDAPQMDLLKTAIRAAIENADGMTLEQIGTYAFSAIDRALSELVAEGVLTVDAPANSRDEQLVMFRASNR